MPAPASGSVCRTPPGWRNGIRGGLKHHCPKGLVGSNPTPGTVGGGADDESMPHVRPLVTRRERAGGWTPACRTPRTLSARRGDQDDPTLAPRLPATRLPRGQHTSLAVPALRRRPPRRPAYAELLGWYLGDGHISRGRRGVYNLHVYNDQRTSAERAHRGADARGEAGRPSAHPQCRVPRSPRSPGSTGPACSPSTAPAASTSARSASSRGSRRSSTRTRPTSSAGCSTPTAPAPTTGHAMVAGETQALRLPALGVRQRSDDIIGICAAALDLLGLALDPVHASDSISVARGQTSRGSTSSIGPKA